MAPASADPISGRATFAASYAAAGHERRVGSVAWIEIELDRGAADDASILGRLTADIEIRTVEGASPGVRAVGLRLDDQVITVRVG